MAKQQKQPMPSPLNQVLNTGTIGGGHHTEKQDTEIRKGENAEMQQTVNTQTQKAENTEHDEEMKKQTIVISKRLATKLKVFAASHNETITTIATKALEEYFARHED